MNKNWKKRLKYTWKDINTYGASMASSLVVALPVTLVGEFVFGYHGVALPIITIAVTTLACFGYYIKEALFADTHEYDKRIQKEEIEKGVLERVEQIKQEEAEREAKKKRMEHLLALLKESARLSHLDMMNTIQDIVKTIHEILKKEIITVDENHYLAYTLPRDITEMLQLYGELDKERKQVKEDEILSFLGSVQENLQENFVERYQKETLQALDKKLLVSTQRMYERE